jgi:hypothetical protein
MIQRYKTEGNPPLLVQNLSKENCITPDCPQLTQKKGKYNFLYIHHHDYYGGNVSDKK